MRLLYECDCGHRWKGRDKITHPSRCPKCNSCLWTIYEFKYYDGRKLKAKEAGLTDNDECNLHGESLKELKRLFDKGMALWSKRHA